ncbi:MAG: deoxyguanosinetriphosphate triphosphohydrolase [Tissierellia bacterium]|nr:deoxyguanosinetriphosphate triphosphohydrolase [Tissierellia bacterium]
MNIRERTEEIERNTLSIFACLSENSKGRIYTEKECEIRTVFQRDRDRIIHSKAFRRLKRKTQVFVAPKGDHYRTRLTHTLEVSQIGRTIARALRMNEDLVEAICLAHDLGHTPFGHTGERILNDLNKTRGFRHYEQSLRVVDVLEQRKNNRGLNLTMEVRDGILNHSGKNKANTIEGKIVKYADRIAYINHDIDDSIRAGVLDREDLPKDVIEVLGETGSQRINTMILDLVKNSFDKEDLTMSKEVSEATDKLRNFMFDMVYLNSLAKSQDEKAEYVITEIYNYYLKNFSLLPKEHLSIYTDDELEDKELVITDYIAGTTDNYILTLFEDLFIPSPWRM